MQRRFPHLQHCISSAQRAFLICKTIFLSRKELPRLAGRHFLADQRHFRRKPFHSTDRGQHFLPVRGCFSVVIVPFLQSKEFSSGWRIHFRRKPLHCTGRGYHFPLVRGCFSVATAPFLCPRDPFPGIKDHFFKVYGAFSLKAASLCRHKTTSLISPWCTAMVPIPLQTQTAAKELSGQPSQGQAPASPGAEGGGVTRAFHWVCLLSVPRISGHHRSVYCTTWRTLSQ